MRKQSQSSQGNFFARIAIRVSLDETYSDVHTNVKNYLFIFPSLSFKSLCGLQVKMGTSQSRYKDKDNDIEEGGKMVQNVKKIHGMARLISAKHDHQRLVAAQGWSKQDENMVT